jgi:PD-(D/E)XK nuclease superfamily
MVAQVNASTASKPCYSLSPSSFAFLYDECPRCFWLQVKHKLYRPRAPFPKMFGNIDAAQKRFYNVGTHCLGYLRFRVEYTEEMITSVPIIFDDVALRIRGKFDSVLRFSNKQRAVADFKTAAVRDEHVEKYSRQLRAYRYAFENPASGSLRLSIDRLGLVIFEPTAFSCTPKRGATFSGVMEWVEVERDDAAFLNFLGQVAALLGSETAPEPDEKCEYCAMRVAS